MQLPKQERHSRSGRGVGVHGQCTAQLDELAKSATAPLDVGNPQLELERQLQVPLFGDRPIELGMHSIAQVEERLRAVPRYRELFAAAYPGEVEPLTMMNAQRALAAFERTLISGDSAFDRYMAGDASALSASAQRGMVFVTSNEDHRFECNHCHGGFNFSDHTVFEAPSRWPSPPFHQTGLYDLDGAACTRHRTPASTT